jgi:hypothetical protein
MADEIQLPGEVEGDEYVVLHADLVGDPDEGVVHVRRGGDDGPLLSDLVLRNGQVRNVWLEDVRFNGVYLDGKVDWWAWGRDLTPWLEGLTINGVEIAPLLDAELDRRHPERQHLRGIETIDRLRAAFPHVEAMWAPTIEWARSLPDPLLHEQVDGEYSFLETLRHLVFATDAWIRRLALGQDQPFHPLAKAYPDDSGCWSVDGKAPWSEAGIDLDADPTLDEVLAVREENFALIRTTLDEADDEWLQSTPAPPQTPGYPSGTTQRSVLRCFLSNVNEEWWHHQYARRDLARLTEG